MTTRSPLQRAHDLVRAEWRHLTTFNPSTRRWQMPFAAALASGLPLMVGAWFGHLEYGLISSIGGLTFLYLPNTPLSHRMVWLMACGFGMSASYALGLMTHFLPLTKVGVLALIAMLVTIVCRFYRVGPPGSLFFVMAAAIGAYSPGTIEQIPLRVGLLTMGALLASAIAFCYSLYILRLQAPEPVAPLPPPTFDFVVFDAVIFITPLTLLLAEAATLGHAPIADLIQSRFIDTVLGCVVGLVGGICLHSARFRAVVGGPLRRLMPRRPQS